MRKPFFRKQCKCWYVKNERGRFIRLDPNEDMAYKIWERMRQLADYAKPDPTIEAICEAFLRIHKSRFSEEKFQRAIHFLSGFCKHVGPTTKAKALTESDLIVWLDLPRLIRKEKGQWSVARKRDAGQVITRVTRWAHAKGYMPLDPFALIRFEQPQPRDGLITPVQHAALMHEAFRLKRGCAFGVFLIALRCGARPIQIRDVTSNEVVRTKFVHDGVDREALHWMFQRHKTRKRTGKPLIVQLPPCLQTLTRILQHFRPSGNLFLTVLGQPWTKDAVALRFRRMRERLNMPQNLTAYNYRHTFATDALASGMSVSIVAELLGHADATMVSRVYGHLSQHGDLLRNAAAEVARNRLTHSSF